MVLTDNVRLPENLELMVSLVPRENVSEAMSDAIRDTMLDISAIVDDIAYFNMSLHDWVVENGVYDVHVAASSRDIRLSGSFVYNGDMPYSTQRLQRDMVG
jgi:hypothetical protein